MVAKSSSRGVGFVGRRMESSVCYFAPRVIPSRVSISMPMRPMVGCERGKLVTATLRTSSLAPLALVALVALAAACSSGSAAGTGAPSDAGVADTGNYAVCPPGLDASFDDLLGRVMATTSCGSNDQTSCHSAKGAVSAGDLLDFTAAADAVYGNLVNKPATNISGDVSLLRVAPGDAGGSMLYVKMTLKTVNNLHYGAGMPLTTPGSVCPEALDAFRTWIDTGAKR